jgi:hypothetical protein
MTIHDLKFLGEQNGGLFFSRNNMKFAKDTMKSFSFHDNKDGTADVIRKRDGTKWTFSTKTGLVVHNARPDTHWLVKLATLPLNRIACHNFAFGHRLHD